MRSKTFLVFGFLLLASFCFAQQEIYLLNPSFEDLPRHSLAPKGWENCGFEKESPPDILPGSFYVEKLAQDGKTYLGLVCRENETWEMVGQPLSVPLKKDLCYNFSLFLCRSTLYMSGSKETNNLKNHVTPCKIKIWGGTDSCVRTELLDETALIINTNWKSFEFTFKPKEDCPYFLIEVFYKEPTQFAYNGNVLIDNASPIVQVACE